MSDSKIEDFVDDILPNGIVCVWWRRQFGPQAPIDQQAWFTYPEQREQILDTIQRHSDHDVYISPASYSKQNRGLENVQKVKSIWLDADSCHPSNLRVKPTWTVQSSPGRFQTWYILDKEVDAREAALVVKKIAYNHRNQGADISSHSANKLMRTVQSVNSNHGFPVKVTGAKTGPVYTLEDIAKEYSDVIVERPNLSTHKALKIEEPDDLPDYGDALGKLPQNLLTLALKEPAVGGSGNRSEVRYRLLCDLLRYKGITFEEALSIAWAAPASRKWREEDSRGFGGLLYEAGRAQQEVEYEEEIAANIPRPAEQRVVYDSLESQSLLSVEEREAIEGYQNYVSDYLGWSETKTYATNPPYNEMNSWVALSASFADCGYIDYENAPGELTLFTMTSGQTTSGKTQALKLLRQFLSAVHSDDPDYNIGGDASPQGLAKKLHERDRKVSWLNKDEVHGWLKQLVDPKNFGVGMLESLAELYDGYLSPTLRTSKEESGEAYVRLVIHMMGTPEELTNVLTKDLFKSGFLARFLWAIGNPRNVTPDSVKAKYGRKSAEQAADGWVASVTTDFKTKRHMFQSHGGRVPIDFSAVAERADQASWDIVALVKEDDPNYDILNPSLVRLGETVKRCAALLAMSRGERIVSMDDLLFSLKCAETWARNVMAMASQIAASMFERECNDVETYVASRPNQSVGGSTIFNHFRSYNPRDFLVILDSLTQQGRLLTSNVAGNKLVYKINNNPIDQE